MKRLFGGIMVLILASLAWSAPKSPSRTRNRPTAAQAKRAAKKYTKKYAVPLIHYLGMRALEEAAEKPTWKTVWSAGQSVGLVDEILSVREIIGKLVREYEDALVRLPYY